MTDNDYVKSSASLQDLEYIRIAADSSHDIITIVASDAKSPAELRFLYANEGCARLFGYTVDDIIEGPVTMFDGPDTDRVALNAWLVQAQLGETTTSELLQYRKDRTPIWIELRIHATEIQDGRTVFVGVGRDISDRRMAQAKINELVRIDSLTGLFNRASLTEQLQAALDRARFAGKMTAVLHLDVDGFKVINELHGRNVGDKLLIALGQRLKDCLRARDVVARQNGDEFIIALPEIDAPFVAADVARRIQGDLTSPFWIGGKEIYISASIGISLHPTDGSDVETLLRNANTALVIARSEGKRRFQFYSPEMHDLITRRLVMVQEIRQAGARKEFVTYFQPIVDLKSGSIIGAEALVRWQHQTRGLLAPGEFIPIAEDVGLIALIGAQVLDEACARAVRWERLGFGKLQVAVNVSPRQILTAGFAESVVASVAAAGLTPQRLVLEITETAMHEPTSVVAVLESLRASGIKIAFDDFGTGYSSLSWLQRLPKDIIKVDRSFVTGLKSARLDKSMADLIVMIGHRLGLVVVAEGVETAEQAAILRDYGCDLAQGYYYSPPVSANAFEQMLESRNAMSNAS